MQYCLPITVSERVVSDDVRLIAGKDKKNHRYILLVPTIISTVTELYYEITKEEYERVRENKRAGFAPFVKYGENRYLPVEDDRFLGIALVDDLFPNKIRASKIRIMIGHSIVAIFIVIRSAT